MATTKYYYTDDGRFVIEGYNHAKGFSSFFPGIAGKHGIPIWGFYVNRGQAMAGFGVQDKDGAIQEFVPADKAPWYTMARGFRTLIRDSAGGFYEPFRVENESHWDARNRMIISPADVELVETNPKMGLETTVRCCTLPEERVGGLLRATRFTNTGTDTIRFTVVDGLAVLIPAGSQNALIKNMGATLRAWMTVSQRTGVPFYKLSFMPEDVPELHRFDYGHFYMGYLVENDGVELIPPIVDPRTIFGEATDYQPYAFMDPGFTYPQSQSGDNHLPCAMGYLEIELAPGESREIYGIYGRSPSEDFLSKFIPAVHSGYFGERWEINRNLIRSIQSYAATRSGQPLFDGYMGQVFLDNVVRGGLPLTLTEQNEADPKVFWLYSRKHGDLERDYNDFQLSPSYYSQGNGNFRDINQNRRHDLWFNTDVGDSVLRYFWNLIQLDGYNPLGVQGLTYELADPHDALDILGILDAPRRERLMEKLKKPFTPGDLLLFLEQELQSPEHVIRGIFLPIMRMAQEVLSADPKEGFWVDHWIYNLDLMESFAGIFPDRIIDVWLRNKDYTFYDNWDTVAPSERRYYLVDGEARQKYCYGLDKEKKRMIQERASRRHMVRTQMGAGEIYHTNLLAKTLTLIVNKLASFDPYVAGLEMDASRPGWCDAINGLPGIFGSSVNEVFALGRILGQVQDVLRQVPGETFELPEEVGEFLAGMDGLLDELPASIEERYGFWESAHLLRDTYLQRTRLGVSGRETPWETGRLLAFIEKALGLVEQAKGRAYQSESGVYTTYLYYQVTRWRALGDPVLNSKENAIETRIWPEAFEQYRMPNFLEGQVHALRAETRPDQAEKLYNAVRRSNLFDEKLSMYKVCADLSEAPYDIGRIRVFPRGWLENESVFLHMEYKYLLEILRSGLIPQFFSELPKLLVCYMDPEVYGRNPLENCSFIVASGNPQTELHGRGFVARLSGSTAEMVHIWLMLCFGRRPFTVRDGELVLELRPTLDSDYFTSEETCFEEFTPEGKSVSVLIPPDSFAVKFLGKTVVVYRNAKRRPTFGPDAVQPRYIKGWTKDGQFFEVEGSCLKGEMAERARRGDFSRIEIVLE